MIIVSLKLGHRKMPYGDIGNETVTTVDAKYKQNTIGIQYFNTLQTHLD